MTSTPSFLLTYYNPFDKNAPGLVDSYLKYAKDVNLAKYSAGIVSEAIEKASKAEIKAMQDGFMMLDQRLSMLVYQQISTNLLLEDIKELLKVPDSEKEKLFHIQSGLKFLSKISRNEDVIFDAISEFEKALNITPQDWFVNYHLGVCYLHYPNALNLEKSKQYFTTAIKYASIEDNYSLQSSYKAAFYSVENQEKELKYSTIWPAVSLYDTPERLKSLKENWFLLNDDDAYYDLLTAPFYHLTDSYLNLAQIDYILGNFEDAYENAYKAGLYDFRDVPGLIKFGYELESFEDKKLFFQSKYAARGRDSIIPGRVFANSLAERFIKNIKSIPLLYAAKHDKDILMLSGASAKIDSIILENQKKSGDKILSDGLRVKYESIDMLVNFMVEDWSAKQNLGLDFYVEYDEFFEFDIITKFLYKTFSRNQAFQLFLERSQEFVEISDNYVYWVGKNKNEMELQKEREIIEAKIKWDEIIGLLPEELDQSYILQKYTEYGGFLKCDATLQEMINDKLKNGDSSSKVLNNVKKNSYFWQIVSILIAVYFFSQGDTKWGFIGVGLGASFQFLQWLENKKSK